MSDIRYDRVVKDFTKFLIDKSKNGNVEWQEIAETLHEEKGITFDWIGES
jgi:hypothetical protein